MNARHKLNRANLTWAMLLGLLFGWLCNSFSAFVMVTIVFIASAWYAGDIRTDGDYHYPAPPFPPLQRPPNPRPRAGRSRRRRRR